MSKTFIVSATAVFVSFGLLPAHLAAPIAAVSVVLLIRWMPRLGGTERQRAMRVSQQELPLVLDTMALALESGIAWDRVVGIAAAGCPEPLASELAVAAHRLAMGATAQEAWSGSSALDVVREVVDRSQRSGSAVSQLLHQQAEELRAQHRMERLQRARRVGTLVIVPMTFLGVPGYLLLGILPTVVTIFQASFSGMFPTGSH